MASFRPIINKDILTWAREWSGTSLEELLIRFPAYLEWEHGELFPTKTQLQTLASKLRIPVGFFFLTAPPDVSVDLPDFRTLEADQPSDPSPELWETFNLMERRQEWIRKHFIEDDFEPLPFVGSVTVDDSIYEVADSLRETLQLEVNWANSVDNYDDALVTLRQAIEEIRIMVFVMGYAGNNTRRKFSVKEFRGFVLCDDMAPLILVNGRDAKQAQIFTLIHELAHLWVGSDGLINLKNLLPTDDPIERFCDQVAAEFLVPEQRFGEAWNLYHDRDDRFRQLARYFKVSQIVASRRALDLDFVTRDEFFDFYRQRQEDYIQFQKNRSPGGHYWNTQGTRLGRLFGGTVVNAVKGGRLLYTDAFELTGLRSTTFSTFAERLGISI